MKKNWLMFSAWSEIRYLATKALIQSPVLTTHPVTGFKLTAS